jgi:WD40 repeat protein
MRQCIPVLILLTCQPVGAQEPAAPPLLVLDSGGHTSIVRKVLFTPDGKELISVSDDETIRFWDVASGEPIRVVRPPIGTGNQGRLYAAALSPDGRTLAVGGYGLKDAVGSIYLISTVTGRIEHVLKGHTSVIQSLAFGIAPGGRLLLASGSYDHTARIWDPATRECQRVLEGHTDSIHGVAFAPDASRLATASYDKTARIWSMADGRCLRALQGHANEVQCVAWSPDGTLLATGGVDRSIKFWSPDGTLSRNIENRENAITSVVFTADSSELLYTWGQLQGHGYAAAVLRVSSGQDRVRFTKHSNSVQSGAISPDGTVAATAGGDSHEIYLWRLTDAAPLHRLAGKGNPNWSAGWSPDGKRIAWGNTYKEASPNDRGPLERSFLPADLDFGPSPDASYQRARESRGSLSLQLTGESSLAVKQQDAVLANIAAPYPRERIHSFSFVTGDRVAVGGDFGLYLFNARTGARIRDFQGHTSDLWAVAPSPDGRFLLSASGDDTVRIWDPDRDEPLLSLFVADDDWIAWTPEGYYAASPGGENLMGWQVSNGPEQVGTFAPASQFHKSLYRPDVIKLTLKTGSVASALERLNEPLKVVKEVLPPLVVITSPDHSGVRVDKPEFTVRAQAVAQPGHPVTALRLLLDGRPYNGELGRKDLGDDPAGANEKTETWQVRLEPGRHRLAVIAESDVSNGVSSEREVIYDQQQAEPPRLYALLVGVADYEDESLRLKYAADDAELLDRTLREKAKNAFATVEVKRLVDRQATREAFFSGLQWLKDSMKTQDVGIIFFSGHGHRDDDGIFYMLPAEVKRQSIAATALDSALFKRKLAGIKGTLVVLLDACHAGAVDKDAEGVRQLRPITSEFIRDMVQEDSGIIMMCSSRGQEVSREDAQLGHGFFTQALTEGLSGGADSNKDGKVYLTELDSYLFDRVKTLSEDRQHPVTAKPASVVPFVVSRP